MVALEYLEDNFMTTSLSIYLSLSLSLSLYIYIYIAELCLFMQDDV